MTPALLILLASAGSRSCAAISLERGGHWDGDPGVESPEPSERDARALLRIPVTAPLALDLCVRVSAQGAVTDLVVQSPTTPAEGTERLLAGVRSLRFTPGTLDGQDVDVWTPMTWSSPFLCVEAF